MAKHIREFEHWVDEHDWPKVACPECGVGNLALGKKPAHVLDLPSQEVVDLHRKNLGPPDELAGTFHGELLCDNSSCKRRVTIAGDWRLVFNNGDPALGEFGDIYQVRYFNPPLTLVELPLGTPTTVQAAVHVASAVLWTSPPDAASRLRQAIEALLTARKVKRYVNNPKTKKRERLSLHKRIDLFKVTHPEVAEALLAMKWIGNDGAHEDALTVSRVLVGAAIFEAAIKALYDKSEEELKATVKKINAKKGFAKSKS